MVTRSPSLASFVISAVVPKRATPLIMTSDSAVSFAGDERLVGIGW